MKYAIRAFMCVMYRGGTIMMRVREEIGSKRRTEDTESGRNVRKK